jgi:hypothetical protein
VVDHLTASPRARAIHAILLLVNICHARVKDTGWEYSEFAQYDLDQAIATRPVEHSMGLACRQFRAFDRNSLTGLLKVPPQWDIMTMTAIGRPANSARRRPRASSRTLRVTRPGRCDRPSRTTTRAHRTGPGATGLHVSPRLENERKRAGG